MFNKIAEDKIREAMLAGEFDNLPGKGKPLNLEENPFEPEDICIANNLLRQNNFCYPWMEKANEIQSAAEQLRLSASQCWPLLQTEGEKARFKSQYSQEIKTLNLKILDYNLQVPAPAFQKPALDPDLEIMKITG
jgi:DnaJ homolog subfamily C member 28